MEASSKVLFCGIAWMKHYQGVTEEDKPLSKSSYVVQTGDAHESEIFRPYDHVCRGYMQVEGNLKIERIDSTAKGDASVDGVTVIWVAPKGSEGRRIVGWYENAKVYREAQKSREATRLDGTIQEYRMEAREEDCVLIPADDRSFPIPSAPKVGKGRGMGDTSHIWYADAPESADFRKRALEYVASYDGPKEKFYLDSADLAELALDDGLEFGELMAKAASMVLSYEALKIANLVALTCPSFEPYMLQARILSALFFYREAEEAYKKAIYEDEDDINAWKGLGRCAYMRGDFPLAVECDRRIIKASSDSQVQERFECYLAKIYSENSRSAVIEDISSQHILPVNQFDPEDRRRIRLNIKKSRERARRIRLRNKR